MSSGESWNKLFVPKNNILRVDMTGIYRTHEILLLFFHSFTSKHEIESLKKFSKNAQHSDLVLINDSL